MRSRNIKPGYYRDAELIECSLAARWVAPGLWMLADREGRLKDCPKQIKIELAPCENCDMDGLLGELSVAKHIIRYQGRDGNSYIQIRNFTQHQNPHKNEPPSKIPAYSESSHAVDTLHECSGKNQSTPADSLIPDSLIPEKKILSASKTDAARSNGQFILTKKKRKLTGKRLESFIEFWTAFNYKRGKAEAADAWMDIPDLTNAVLAQIIEAATREAKGRLRLQSQGLTPKMAQGWITGRRWEDEATTSTKESSWADTYVPPPGLEIVT